MPTRQAAASAATNRCIAGSCNHRESVRVPDFSAGREHRAGAGGVTGSAAHAEARPRPAWPARALQRFARALHLHSNAPISGARDPAFGRGGCRERAGRGVTALPIPPRTPGLARQPSVAAVAPGWPTCNPPDQFITHVQSASLAAPLAALTWALHFARSWFGWTWCGLARLSPAPSSWGTCSRAPSRSSRPRQPPRKCASAVAPRFARWAQRSGPGGGWRAYLPTGVC